MKIFQKGFNYSQDGPGNRLVLHLQGCNMRCPWCSNPEGLEMNGTLVADDKWLYDELCPHGAIKNKKLDRSFCDSCKGMECLLKRGKALSLPYEEYTVEEVLEMILASKMMCYDGGGVTFTGGEATLQFDELLELLKRLKLHKINTAIETNGTHKSLEEIFPYVDHLIIDCKLIDDFKHKAIMAVSNKRILENIKKASLMHPKVHIRIPMIGGVNDSSEEIADFISFFKSLKQENISYEVLKYHEFGRKKWDECGLIYTMTDKAKLGAKEVETFRKKIEEAGLHYVKT